MLENVPLMQSDTGSVRRVSGAEIGEKEIGGKICRKEMENHQGTFSPRCLGFVISLERWRYVFIYI